MNLANALAASARTYPDRTALIWDEGTRRRTYRELDDRVDALAMGLSGDLGLTTGDRVAVMMYNNPTLLEILFAVWRVGATVVPLNARFTPGEVEYHVHDAGARVFVAGPQFVDLALDVRERLADVEFVLVDRPPNGVGNSLEELMARAPRRPPPSRAAHHVHDDDVAWLAYTSGTTGRPKGAMLTHGGLTFVALSWLADLQRLEPEDVGLYAAPLTHGAGMMALAFTMKACTQVILQPSGFDPQRFCETVARERVTHTWLVPTQIKMLLDHPCLDGADLSTLKTVLYGGSPMYVEDLKSAIKRIGPIFVQLFAQTESPMTATYLRAAEHILDGPGSERLASCGHARSAVEVAILDGQDRRVGAGVIGEICVRGPALMKGYWNRPDATAETLRGGWLHTGDIGRMDELGYVYILDRSKDMVISGGLNIYPREVEEVLLTHPAISEAAVIGLPDEKWGERLKAVVVPRPGAAITEADVVSFCAVHLASYKKPRSVDFVEMLPKTTYGKIDKKALRAPYWAGHSRLV
jgi:long-chain acyl-CoA synthetase